VREGLGGTLLAPELLVENDQMILGVRQLGYTDGMAPKHSGSNIRSIITGAENDDSGARDVLQNRSSKSLSVETSGLIP